MTMSDSVRYPGVRVSIPEANVFSVVSRVAAALRRADAPRHDVDDFATEAMATRTHQGLMEVVKRWVEVDD